MARRRTSHPDGGRADATGQWPADWVGPYQAGSPAPVATRVGVLDGEGPAWVDPRGLVVTSGVAVDWWVGSEQRWHLPATEVGVRQALLGGAPVVETRVRVPSGDAVARTYGARTPSGAAVVVEITNDSAAPLAVALAVRPHDLTGPVSITEVAVDGGEVRADGRLVLVAERPPHHGVVGDASRDVAAVVTSNGARPLPGGAARQRCGLGRAQAALVFALSHRATLRALVPLSGEPGPVPDAASVASGWAAQRARGARLVPPAGRLADALAATRCHLLLGSTDRGAPVSAGQVEPVVVALAELGLADEAATVLGAALRAGTVDCAWVRATARHLRLAGTLPAPAGEVAPAVAAALEARLRAVSPTLGTDAVDLAEALTAGAQILDIVGEDRAAADTRRALDRLGVGPLAGGAVRADGVELRDSLAQASATWAWPAEADAGGRADPHDLARTARFVSAARRALVAEVPSGANGDELALAPLVPDDWLGQSWEVHDAPTALGTASYAVRWHGARPALLWEVQDPPGGVPPLVRAPGLDPRWSSREARGEVLLAAPSGAAGARAGTAAGGVRS